MKRLILTIILFILSVKLGLFVLEMVDFANGVKQDTIRKLNWKQNNSQKNIIDLPTGIDTIE